MSELEKIKEKLLFSDNESIDIKDVRYTEESAKRIIKITDYNSIRKMNKKILKEKHGIN